MFRVSKLRLTICCGTYFIFFLFALLALKRPQTRTKQTTQTTANKRHQTNDTKQTTPNKRHQTNDTKQSTPNKRHQTNDSKPHAVQLAGHRARRRRGARLRLLRTAPARAQQAHQRRERAGPPAGAAPATADRGAHPAQPLPGRAPRSTRSALYARTLRNLCQAALDSHARWEPEDREAIFSACLCCHHWVARRKKTTLVFPLQALSWYVNTLRTVGGKNMDHRVVMRLCAALNELGPLPRPPPAVPRKRAGALASAHANAAQTALCLNHYSFLFNAQELALFRDIAAHGIDCVGARIAHFYHRTNARTIFSPSSSLVEKLRKCHSDAAADPDAEG